MIEHIARFPRVRDRALFVGTPDDIVADRFGPGLPLIREWTEEHYDFTGGYITASTQRSSPTRALAARAGISAGREGLRRDGRRIGRGRPSATQGGGVVSRGQRLVPELRMIVVAGPRIDPVAFTAADGLEVRGYVPDLYRHLARATWP